MNVSKFLRQIEKFSVDNSPTILTTIGAIGTVATAVLTHKAATKAEQILGPERATAGVHHQLRGRIREEVPVVWKIYIPTVLVGSATVLAIVGANRIGSKRAAALAAAYTISDRAFEEYKNKVREHMGDRGAEKIRDDIARDRVAANQPSEGNVVLVGSGDVLCCDLYSGRYFNSSIEEIKKAMNDTNYQIINHQYASLTDFYERIGLPRTKISEEVGWNSDKMLDIGFSAVVVEDGRPCVTMDFMVMPIRRYHHLNG